EPGALVKRRGILIDSGAIHVFHHQVRPPVGGMTGIQQPCDCRMVQIGKKLPLPEETVAPGGTIRIGAKQLDRNLLLDLAIAPLGQVDGAHATRTKQLNQPVPALYDEPNRIAARPLRGERPNHALQATALVHEAYMKLFGGQKQTFADEVHFLAVSSRVMRQVLVDYAKARATKKRSGVN